MAGIKDVAKLAGVSQAIVSRVINQDQTLAIRDSTRDRVLWAIRELDYRPNMLGRNLRSNSTKLLGVFVPDIINPYFAELLTGVEDAALESGFRTMFFNTSDSPEKELELVYAALEYHVDGFLIASVTSASKILNVLSEEGKPYVMIQRRADKFSGSYIGTDDAKGSYLSVEHLVQLGHERIAYIAGDHNTYSGEKRKNEFFRAMEYFNLTVPDSYVVDSGNRIDDAYNASLGLLEQETIPTAIVCYNDMLAIGAITAVLAKGLRIPEDISIIGCDDIWMSAQMCPPLTTVCASIWDLGYSATNMLVNHLKNPDAQKKEIITDVKLIVRKSTGPCPQENAE